MTHGTAVHGIGIHGLTVLGDITDGMTAGIMDTAVGTTHGTMDMQVGTAICIRITADGTEDGIHTGDTTITTIQAAQSTTETNGTEAVTRAVPTEYLPAEFRFADVHQQTESTVRLPEHQAAV